ncbi:MAG: DUF1992 domain-containing protein [Methylohalobius sp.]
MLFLERLAERKIEEAMARGEFDRLSCAGKPLPEDDLPGVAPELRLAYRLLKNAGYVPEEVSLRREIAEVQQLLDQCRDEAEQAVHTRRLYFLLERLGQVRSSNLVADAQYLEKLAERIAGLGQKKTRQAAGQKRQERRFNATEEEEEVILRCDSGERRKAP